MPWFEFTVVIEGVDLLADATLEAIDEHSSQFLEAAPLDAATYSSDGGTQRAIFDLEASTFNAAVKIALAALSEALPDASITSITPGRHPGRVDIL